MTKAVFIKVFNDSYKINDKSKTICFLHLITRLSIQLCTELVNSIWNCTHPKYFGNNIYLLLEVSANSDSSVQFNPKLRTTTCGIYIIYPDDHAAAFALYKIKKYKHE